MKKVLYTNMYLSIDGEAGMKCLGLYTSREKAKEVAKDTENAKDYLSTLEIIVNKK